MQVGMDPHRIAAGSIGPEPESRIRAGREKKRTRRPADGLMTNLDLIVDRLKMDIDYYSDSGTM